MPGYLRHMQMCHGIDLKNYRPFFIDHVKLGWVKKDLSDYLLSTLPNDFIAEQDGLTLEGSINTYQTRSAALARAAELISSHYKVPLRNELYSISNSWDEEVYAEVDRAAVPWLGTRGFGVHVNGYVKRPDGLYLWVGERAANRQIDPGKLDNVIGGGLPIGLSIEENLIKESWEEAGIDAAIAQKAKPVSSLSYVTEKQFGIRNDTLFLYDMELPDNVRPTNTDGEVAAFHLMPLDEVATIIKTTDRFKFNCNLIIIDFLQRQGFFKAPEPELSDMMIALKKARGPFPIRPSAQISARTILRQER